jgi:hypothetical protein
MIRQTTARGYELLQDTYWYDDRITGEKLWRRKMLGRSFGISNRVHGEFAVPRCSSELPSCGLTPWTETE